MYTEDKPLETVVMAEAGQDMFLCCYRLERGEDWLKAGEVNRCFRNEKIVSQ